MLRLIDFVSVLTGTEDVLSFYPTSDERHREDLRISTILSAVFLVLKLVLKLKLDLSWHGSVNKNIISLTTKFSNMYHLITTHTYKVLQIESCLHLTDW